MLKRAQLIWVCAVLAKVKDEVDTAAFDKVVNRFCDEAARNNPAFNKERFVKAAHAAAAVTQ